jgi:pyrroline-5-carboxylate reductase
MQKLGIIGCGNMGGAIAQSLPDGAVVYDSDQQKMEVLTRFPGIEAASSLEDLLDRSQRVLLAVKPQILPSLYPILRNTTAVKKLGYR